MANLGLLQGSVKSSFKLPARKLRLSAKSPNVITAMVYIIRFSNSAAMTAVAGIPSRIIKKALAGCPPDADGVIAEK